MADITALSLLSADPHATAGSAPNAQMRRGSSSKNVSQPRSGPVPRAVETNGVTKRKQSKSRNGCSTCKAKRLKCDETKPTCQQCARRSVVCGGYKKDFKWRAFEETTFTGKPAPKVKKGAASPNPVQPSPNAYPVNLNSQHHASPNVQPPLEALYTPPILHGLPQNQTSFPTSNHAESWHPPTSHAYTAPQQPLYMLTPQSMAPATLPPQDRYSLENSSTSNNRFVGSPDFSSKVATPSSTSFGQSPRLVDLLLPGTDLNVAPAEYRSFRQQHGAIYEPTGLTPPTEPVDEDEDVEEIPRAFNPAHEPWTRSPSPNATDSSRSSSSSRDCVLYTQPAFSFSSPEMLTRRFDRETCGVLSVKDGPTENPWRTLIWPLARDCPALYHAIASLTSFHQSRDTPALRIQGIDHMRSAIHALAMGIEKMRIEAAISTTLALAFSESWDQHISTGINHIKGAKILIDRALVQHQRNPMRGEEFTRLKFLCYSWVYMDVLARLTSADDDGSNDFDTIVQNFTVSDEGDTQLDPLMGCASTLFPIIGRVANLVRKVRRTEQNSPAIISQAIELKKQLEDWMPPSYIDHPEDETTSPHDTIKTATAYQHATLLYLHQAVPEAPSLPSLVLAEKILRELAMVHSSSRSIIIHMFPLMAAGGEMVEVESRDWVRKRWEMMYGRMKLGIIEKCLQVTKEVWTRRDAYKAESMLMKDESNGQLPTSAPISSLKRHSSLFLEDPDSGGDLGLFDSNAKRRAMSYSNFDGPRPVPVTSVIEAGLRRSEVLGTEHLEHEFSVRGRLHWLGVMRDWGWEILLG